jgi:intracellular sulfur oxidation DsrE/DsrF family protein
MATAPRPLHSLKEADMSSSHWTLAVIAAGMLALSAGCAEASHSPEYPKKHKVFYHFNDGGVEKARAMLVNIENHLQVVGWKNIEALELVVHGPALRTFLARDIDPEVRGKLETLLAGGLRFDACQITMTRQKIDPKHLLHGATAVPSGVARVMELQEAGYAYVKP